MEPAATLYSLLKPPHCTWMELFRSVLACFTKCAFKHGQQFPLVYVLLPGKTREAYNTSFILLKEAEQNIVKLIPKGY